MGFDKLDTTPPGTHAFVEKIKRIVFRISAFAYRDVIKEIISDIRFVSWKGLFTKRFLKILYLATSIQYVVLTHKQALIAIVDRFSIGTVIEYMLSVVIEAILLPLHYPRFDRTILAVSFLGGVVYAMVRMRLMSFKSKSAIVLYALWVVGLLGAWS